MAHEQHQIPKARGPRAARLPGRVGDSPRSSLSWLDHPVGIGFAARFGAGTPPRRRGHRHAEHHAAPACTKLSCSSNSFRKSSASTEQKVAGCTFEPMGSIAQALVPSGLPGRAAREFAGKHPHRAGVRKASRPQVRWSGRGDTAGCAYRRERALDASPPVVTHRTKRSSR